VVITNLVSAGVELHDYEPSTRDIASIEQSNLLILNGGVEAWGERIESSLAGTKTKVIVAGNGLIAKKGGEEEMENHKEEYGGMDPHIWLDPVLAKQESQKIAEALTNTDPTNADYYTQNEKALEVRFDQLDSEYRSGLTNCSSKDIVTSHTAFAYLADRYGLNQIPISGLSPEKEPSPAQLAEIAKFARSHNVKYIFFESLISPRLSETIAREIGAQTLVLDPLEGISDEDLASGSDYFSVMRNNLKNLQTALQCKA
jgi:zinc transport system substrate-binding protein